MPGIASFHLVRERSALRAMGRLGTDRRALASVPGLRFWRLLGTGAGSDTGPGSDLHRTALFAVWDDRAALDAFSASMARRWAAAEEAWHVRLRGHGGHGTWRGFDVLGAIEQAATDDGPVAVITRADVRFRSWRAFRSAGPAVSAELARAEGLLNVAGIGEAPVGRLGTFSIWKDAAAVRSFVHDGPAHVDVVRRTRAEHWYGEELFARFQPVASTGTWDGVDPLVAG